MDDDPIDALQSMPADQGGDEARQEANAAPLATEAPADASARVYQQGTQQRLYGRVRAADLASRGIPSFTTPTGDVKPIVDDTGAAITSADPRNHVGYDSTGNAVSYAKTDDTGKPVLTDPYADAPTVTDKQGNQYSAPKGLGWKWTGTDDDVAAKYQADQQEKIDQATAGAIAPYEQQARSQASQAARAVKQSAKSTAATLAASGVPLTDETGQQAIDLNNVDGPTLKAHINDAFNKEYAAPQANASPMFGGGQFTPQAQAIRQDIDNRKATANAAADAHIDTLSDAQTAQANADALTAQRQQLQASKLDYVNQKRAAMGLAPISIPGVAAKTSQADQSFQTPQESALPGIDTDGKPMPDSAIPGVPKSQGDQPNQSPTFYDRVKNFFQNTIGQFVAGPIGGTVKGVGELISKNDSPASVLMPGGFLNAPAALSKMLGIDIGKGMQSAGSSLESVPGIITNPAWKDNAEAKVGRFVGNVAGYIAGGEVGAVAKAGRAATLIPMLFAGGYADQHDAAQQHFDQQAAAGNPVPPDQAEAIAHRAGIIGGAINAMLGIPLEGAGKSIRAMFGAVTPTAIQDAFLNAYTQNGALGVADALKQFRAIVTDMGGASLTEKEVAAKAAQGLKGVEDEITKSAGDRALGVAGRAARDAAIGAAVQTGQNLTTQTYDPTRGTFQDVPERAAEFGAMGALFGTIDAKRAAGKAAEARAAFGGTPPPDASGNAAVPSGPEAPQGGGGNTGPEGTQNQRHLTQGIDADIASANAAKLKGLGYSDSEIAGMDPAEADRRAKQEIGKPSNVPAGAPTPDDWKNAIQKAGSAADIKNVSELVAGDRVVSKTDGQSGEVTGANARSARIEFDNGTVLTVSRTGTLARESQLQKFLEQAPVESIDEGQAQAATRKLVAGGMQIGDILKLSPQERIRMAFPGGSQETPEAVSQQPSGASVEEQIAKAETQPSPVEDEESLTAEKAAIERAGAGTPELQDRLKVIDAKLANLGASGKAPAETPTKEAPTKGQSGEVPGASPIITQEGEETPSGKAPTIDDAAHEAAASPFSPKPAPSRAQIDANNAKVGKFSVAGIPISIEHPAGSSRNPEKGWPALQEAHYGYLRGVAKSGDSEKMDAFVKTGTPEDYKGPVFVVNRHLAPSGAVDHKVFIGPDSRADAARIHNLNYPEGLHVSPGDVAQFNSSESFKRWATGNDIVTAPAKGDAMPEGWDKPEPGPSLSAIRKMPDADRAERTAMLEKAKTEAAAAMQEARGKDISTYGAEKEKFEFADQALATMRRATEEKTDEPTKENTSGSKGPAQAGGAGKDIAGNEGNDGKRNKQAAPSSPASSAITPDYAKALGKRLRNGKLKDGFDLAQAKLFDVSRPPNPGKEQEKFDEDVKKTSGLKAVENKETEKLEVHHNAVATADSMRNVEAKMLHAGATPEEARKAADRWFETAMKEETIHLPQLISERGGPDYAKTYTGVWQQVPENVRKLVIALRNRKESDAERGAEFERMVIQFRETGTITEANEADADKERWFRELKPYLELKQNQPLEENISRIMRLIAERTGSKREDGKPWKAEVEDKPEQEEERGPPESPSSEPEKSNLPLKFVLPERAASHGDKLVSIDIPKFDSVFKKDAGFYVSPTGEGEMAGKREAFTKFLKTGKPIEAPEVFVDAQGGVSFVNGRHRYAVLRDRGETTIPVAMSPEAEANARKFRLTKASAKPAEPAKPRKAFEGLFSTKPEAAPAFYSQLSKSVSALPQETMTVGQARAAIEKGAKPDEVRMSGILTDPLSPLHGKQPNEKVTRTALRDYAIERQATAQEVTLGDAIEAKYGTPQFAQWQLPGAEPGTYREQFVMWPKSKGEEQWVVRDSQTESDPFKTESDADDWRREQAEEMAKDEPGFTLKRIYNNDEERYQWIARDDNGEEIKRFTSEQEKNEWRDARFRENESKWLEAMSVRQKDDLASGWEDGHSQYSSIQNPIVRLRRNIRTIPGEPSRAGFGISKTADPNAIRETLDKISGSKGASDAALKDVNPLVIAIADNKEVRRAIISRLPVDVMSILRGRKLTPDYLFDKDAMSWHDLPLDGRRKVSSGLVDALRETGAAMRAKISDSLLSGRNEEFLPTLRTSDLSPSEIRMVLSAKGVDSGEPGPAFNAVSEAGAAGEGARSGNAVGSTGKGLSAPLAKLLDSHSSMVKQDQEEMQRPKRILFLEELQGPSSTEQEKMPPEIRKRIYEIGMKRAIREAAELSRGNDAWNRVTEPQSAREQLKQYLGGELASVSPLKVMDAPVLAGLKNNQIKRAVIEAIPVDVVNILSENGFTPEQLAGEPKVVGNALPVPVRATVSRGLADALHLVGARLRTALNGVLSSDASRGDKEVLPAVRASQLDPRIVVGLLSPETVYHESRTSLASGSSSARSGAESSESSLNDSGIGRKLLPAKLADLLNRHELLSRGSSSEATQKYDPGEGVTHLGWTRGETQAERYDLSKQVAKLRWYRNEDGTYKLEGDTHGRGVAFDQDDIPAEKLEQYVGKDLAKKITENAGGRPLNEDEAQYSAMGELSGEGLKVGGEGLKNLYDVTLLRIANEIAKKFGGNTSIARLENATPLADREWKFSGPTPTTQQLDEMQKLAGSHGPNVWDSPITGERQDFPINRVDNASALRRVRQAMSEGMPFGEAMINHGNGSAAKLFGGEITVTDPGTQIHSLELPAELKKKAIYEGFPLFAAKPGPIDQKPLPKDRRQAFFNLADTLEREGVKEPAALAKYLDDVAPGKLRGYAQALWDIMGSAGTVERGTQARVIGGRPDPLHAAKPSAFALDAEDQARWMAGEARGRGYSSTGEMLASEPDSFDRMAKQWRAFHARDEAGKLLQEDGIRAINERLYGPEKQAIPGLEEADFGRRIAGSRDALGDAATVVGANAGAGGSSGKGKDRWKQGEALKDWAEKNGLLLDELPTSLDPGSKKNKGGVEHDSFPDETAQRWIKVTRGPGVDMGVFPEPRFDGWELRAGTPTEYLSRLLDSNQVFGDDVRLHAVVQDKDGLRVVTSQPNIVGSEVDGEGQMDAAFESAGFRPIGYATYYRKRDNTAVFDVHAGNAVESDGVVIPFDAVTVHPTGDLLEAIEDTIFKNAVDSSKRQLAATKPGAIPGFDEEGNLTPDEATIESDSDTKFKRTMRSDEEARLKAASDDSLKRILTGHALTMKGRVERGEQANFWTRMQLGIAYKELLSRGVETPKIPALERYIGNTKELRASKPSREAAESPEFYKEMAAEVAESDTAQKASEPDPDQMADIIAAFKEEKKHSDWPAIHIADVMERAGYAGPTMYLGKQHLMWMWKNGKIASLVGTDWSLTDDRIHAWGIRQHAGNDGVRGIALAIVDSKLNDLHAAKPAGVTLADVLEKTGVTDVIDIIQAGFSPDDRLTREEREKFAASGDPYAIGNARKTGMILDHIFALIDQRKKQWEEALSDARTMIEKLSPKLKLEIMKRVDEGTPLKAGPFKDAFDKIAAMDAMRVKQAKDWFDAHGQEHWKNYENYLKNIVPHYFKDPEQANKVIDRYIKDRNVAGGTGWMKHRSDLTMREIIEWAATQGIKLEPKHDNVIDAIMDRWMQQERYFGAHELMEKMEKEGAGRWVPSDYTLKSGERQINQIVGIRTVNGPEGRRIAQKFVADAPSAQILNNHLSRGLRSGHKAVEHYFTAANRLNALQLGFSGFHAGFVGIEGMVSTFALGIEKILSGDLSGLKDMAFSPFSTVSDWKLGRKIHAGMLNPGGMGSQMAFVVDSMIQGGFRAGQDSFYKNQDIKAFMDALRGHQIFKGVLRAPWAAIELIAKPIMEYFVPYMKAAAVYKLAEMHLKQSPNITATELHRRLQEDVRSGNNRFGQMTYDNLHLHKTVKDLLMGLTRSLGWNWGTFAELGGGFTDWAKFAKDAAIYGARKIGGGGKKPPGGGDDGGANDDDYAPGGAKFPRVTNKMAYTLALPLLVGLFGAVLSAFFGKKPQTLKDYYFVQTGDIDDHGNPVRVVLPSYMKDLFHAFRHPLSTVTNKLHPLLSMVAQMLENKDFYGIEIRHAGDPVMKQILEELKYVGKEVIPFTGRNASKAQSTALKVAGLVGVTQAPAYASKTAAQELADELNAEKMPTSARTQEQADHSALRSQIIGQERAGQQTGLLAKSEAEGKITPHDASYISRMAGMTRLQASVSHLSIDDAQKVLEKATPDEKREIAPIIAQKKARSAKFMYAGGQ